MDAHRRPPPREALSDERARQKALEELLRMEEAKEHTRTWEPPRQTTARRAVLAGLLLIGALWVWLFPPPAIQRTETPQPSDARVAAGLEFMLALQRDRIEAFRVREGRLPDTLAEAGEPLPGLTYERMNPRTYRLRARSGGQTTLWVSSDTTVQLRNALNTLREQNE